MLNFYRRFLPHAAATQAPLHDILSGPRVQRSHPITWTRELRKTCDERKTSLLRATLLAHPDPSSPLVLATDASTSAIGAVLQQRVQNAWQPLAFFSRKLSPAQQKYSAYDRQLVAIYEAVKHFLRTLEARHFIIFTDHKPITFAFQHKRYQCPPRQFNHLDYVSQFTTDIRHISGQDNVVADALSRIESISASVTHDGLAAYQADDDNLQTLLIANTALRLEKLLIAGTTVDLCCEISSGKPRPYVPALLRRQVFQSLRNLCHPGTKATAKLFSQRFVWPGIHKDCRPWAEACQRCKVS
jgi:cleavage and polyadenylation specificity factor subunit 1